MSSTRLLHPDSHLSRVSRLVKTSVVDVSRRCRSVSSAMNLHIHEIYNALRSRGWLESEARAVAVAG